MGSFLIVGLGASAGGVQALQAFFEAVPAQSGIAYVVILHLSPSYDSQLAQVLQNATSMPVTQVTAKTHVEPEHVYVVPPDRHLEMQDGYLIVTPNIELAERRAPVDIFFRSLAESHDSRAVGVILSGTGANGSMGLKRIKERGGAVFVQNPREAAFSEMARNAIATDLVDDVLNVAEIPARIIAYRDSLGTVHIPEAQKDREAADQQALRNVLAELRMRTGHDFANYKRPTLLRRLERRIHVRNLPDLPAYAAFISQHPEETHALLKDLLISVTNFFRDKAPFDELEKTVLPQLLEAKGAEDQLRIWVAGCATGEEAYSIAMICAELTLGSVDAPKVQIFATDIDEAAIATARDGFYTLNDAADVPQEWLARYFTREGDGYRIRRELRETILFANHNFLKDSPFSRIDLVSCRNVLIYLNRVAQERVFETFHFALKAGGFLLLGVSESIDGASELFSICNREQHIWQSRPVVSKNIIVPEGIPRLELPQLPVKASAPPRVQERISFGELHQQLVELYTPPSLVVNEEFDIVHISEHAARYLGFAGGEPTQNLLKLVREELRAELRSALYAAAQRKTGVSALDLKTHPDGRTETINIHVRPTPAGSSTALGGYMLVIFEPVSAAMNEVPVLLTTNEPANRHLEEEVARLKAQLRASNEQHEFAAEELKAGNEELQAMNEELRSATEELETSKEELQSINEELSTVNQELKVKVEESSMTSNNLRNIINSADVGTLILDRSFRVILFTPAARAIFNLIPADHGRPLSDITNKLVDDNLVADAEEVLHTLHSLERELETSDGLHYLTRLSPYRTGEDRIQGVVISLLDITERKRAEASLRQSEDWKKLILQSAEDYAIFTLDPERRVASWNIGAQRMFGYRDEEIIGQRGDIVFVPEDREKGALQQEADTAIRKGRAANERWHLRKDGSRFWGSGLTHPLRDDSGRPVGFVKIMRDRTERKAAEEALRESEARLEREVRLRTAELAASNSLLQATMDSSMDMIQVFKAVRNNAGEIVDFIWILNNHAAEKYYGDVLGKSLLKLNPGVAETGIFATFKEVTQTGIADQSERHYVHEQFDGWFLQSTVKLGDGVATTTTDISGRKRAALELQQSKALMQDIIDAPEIGIAVYKALRNEQGEIIDFIHEYINRASIAMLGGEDFTGRLFTDHGENGRLQMDRLIEVIETGRGNGYIREADFRGRTVWFSITNTPLNGDRLVHTWEDVTERKQAEAEIICLKDQIAQQATDKYQSLFKSVDEGFAILELLYDDAGELTDFCYLETNPAFVRHVGMDLQGKRRSGVSLDQEDFVLEQFRRLIKTGAPIHFEYVVQKLGGQWFQVTASPIGEAGSNLLGVVFRNVTERKQREEEQAFLLKLGDTLRAAIDESCIKSRTVDMVARHLGLDRCWIAEVSEQNGIAEVGPEHIRLPDLIPVTGIFQLSDFPEIMRQLTTQPILIEDVTGDARFSDSEKGLLAGLSIRSLLVAPLRKLADGVIWALVATKAVSRTWTEREQRLLEEVAERTWAAVERVNAEQALQESEERYRKLFENMTEGFALAEMIWDENGAPIDWRYIDVNQAWEQTGVAVSRTVGRTAREVNPDIEPGWIETYGSVVRTGEPVAYEAYAVGFGRWFETFAFRHSENCFALLFRDVSNRRRAEQALRESEEKYRTLFDAMEEGFTICRALRDASGRVTDLRYLEVNRALERQTGLDGRALAGRKLSEVLPPEDFGRWLSIYTRVINSGEPAVFEEYAALLERWFAVSVYPRSGDELAVFYRNITEQRRHEQRQEFLLKFSDALRVKVSADDIANCALRMLSAQLRLDRCYIAVYRPEDDHADFPHQTGNDRVPPLPQQGIRLSDVPEALRMAVDRTLVIDDFAETGNLSDMDRKNISALGLRAVLAATLRTGSNNPRWVIVAVSAAPRHWTGGEIALLEDVTERTWAAVERARAEEALRTSESRFQSVANLVPDLLWDSEPDGFTNWYNQRWLEYTGQSFDDAVGWGWVDAIHPDDREASAQRYRAAVQKGELLRQEHRIRRYDGVYRWFVVDAFPQKGERGSVIKMYSAATDIHESRLLLEAIGKSEERLQKAISIDTVGVMFFSLDGTISRVNDAALRMFGYPETELLALMSWTELADPEFADLTVQTAAKLASIGEAPPYEKRMMRKDGSHWWGLFAPTRLSGEGYAAECVEFIIDITESKRAAEALRASEDRLRTLSDAVPQVIWTNDAAGAANYFNRRWYEYTGLSYEESRGPGWQAVVHPDDAPGSRARWEQALAEGTVFDNEFRLRGADGQYRWFIVRNVPLKHANGRAAGWFGSATDIHDLKMAEEALHESRERLRVTMESATDYAIITMDVEGRIEGWNKGAEHTFGYREADVTGHFTGLIFTPEDRAAGAPQAELEKARLEGRAEDERWHLRRDGSRFYMSGVTTPIYDGQLNGYVKVARDMTGQKEAEERLRVTEERYRIALQSADMAAWDWNVRDDKIRWNDQHFLMLGLQPEDRLLESGFFLQFVHPGDLEFVRGELMQAVNGTGQYRAEAFRIIRKDGQVRWMSGYGRTVAWAEGKSARMVGVMFDITGRKQLEQQKEQFIGIASHELKTPVTSIKAYAEILEELFTENGDRSSAELMHKMNAQVDRLTALIYALLDMTRIAGGRLSLEPSDFSIDELITETTEPLQRIAGSQRIELDLHAGTTIHADRERIRQVLTNLLSNAIKYAPGTERIIVRSEIAGDELRVSVRDFGSGIAADEQDQIFEQFFRAGHNANVSGLGLGLFISSSIIREHGGRIWVESRKGEGAVFYVSLPLAKL